MGIFLSCCGQSAEETNLMPSQVGREKEKIKQPKRSPIRIHWKQLLVKTKDNVICSFFRRSEGSSSWRQRKSVARKTSPEALKM